MQTPYRLLYPILALDAHPAEDLYPCHCKYTIAEYTRIESKWNKFTDPTPQYKATQKMDIEFKTNIDILHVNILGNVALWSKSHESLIA